MPFESNSAKNLLKVNVTEFYLAKIIDQAAGITVIFKDETATNNLTQTRDHERNPEAPSGPPRRRSDHRHYKLQSK